MDLDRNEILTLLQGLRALEKQIARRKSLWDSYKAERTVEIMALRDKLRKLPNYVSVYESED